MPFPELTVNVRRVRRFDAKGGMWRQGHVALLTCRSRIVWECEHIHKSHELATECAECAKGADAFSLTGEEIQREIAKLERDEKNEYLARLAAGDFRGADY